MDFKGNFAAWQPGRGGEVRAWEKRRENGAKVGGRREGGQMKGKGQQRSDLGGAEEWKREAEGDSAGVSGEGYHFH